MSRGGIRIERDSRAQHRTKSPIGSPGFERPSELLTLLVGQSSACPPFAGGGHATTVKLRTRNSWAGVAPARLHRNAHLFLTNGKVNGDGLAQAASVGSVERCACGW